MMRSGARGVLLVTAMILGACGGGIGDDTTTTAGVAQEDTATTEAEATSTTAAEMVEGVHESESALGKILVDPDGFTLYIFTADSDGESTCYDACADLWPPIAAGTPISSDLDDSIFGSTSRTDGVEQLTVNGMPVYLYTPDVNPGDVTGQGFSGVWFVVDGSGTVIEAESSGDVDYDYDY